MEKRFISYQEYGELLDNLIDKIKGREYTAIYGPPRGGLPIAVHLSHHLGVPMVFDFDKWIDEMKVSGKEIKHLLVVDDIADSGKTLLKFEEMASAKRFWRYTTAVLFYKACSVYWPDWLCEIVRPTEQWIVFPWERVDEACEADGTFQAE